MADDPVRPKPGVPTFENKFTLGGLLGIAVSLTTLFGIIAGAGAHYQSIVGSLDAIQVRMIAIERAQAQNAEAAAKLADGVQDDLRRRSALRDRTQEELRGAIDRLTNRVNELSDQLNGRRRGSLDPLPTLAEAALQNPTPAQ